MRSKTSQNRSKRSEPSTMTLSFLNNPDLVTVKGPKTPSPVARTKTLETAGQLLSAAERELMTVEAKLTCDRLLSAKTSSTRFDLPSARRIMNDIPFSPRKVSANSNTLQSRSRTSNRVPQNSPSSMKIHGDEDNYKKNNGEKKSLSLCAHHKDITSSDHQTEENKSKKTEQSDPSKNPAITEFSMFYEQQQLVERKTQTFKEKNSATVIFKSDVKPISSTDVVKHDVQTSTCPSFASSQASNLKFTQNSSIISMKTSKPEEEEQPLCGKVLNVQKMPSVNIRPGFTIQHGPKVNIVGSSSTLYKHKRKNTEFFDVVYPPSSPVCSESSFVSEQMRSNKQMEGHAEYICERHTFPGGRLIPGTIGENLRQTHLQNSLNIEEKKELLIELIKAVTEKIEQQNNRIKKNCCRVICSLPLLASVVRKIKVDCGKCADLLNSHLDRLVALMKEELRSYKELSEDHCCQLDEAIHYQIVELELMQEENSKRRTLGDVTVMKHKDTVNTKPPKKTVSFESIPDQIAESPIGQQRDLAAAINQGKTSVTNLVIKKPSTSKTTKTGVENVNKNRLSSALKKTQLNNIKPSNSKKNINPILKKTTKPSTNTKETTVVGKVLKNLSVKKTNSKQDTVLTEPKSKDVIVSKKPLNALIKVVDQKESTNEFDKWIEERSLKIRQIHEELNNMVTDTMEKYIERNLTEVAEDISNKGLKLLANMEDINESSGTNEIRPETEQRDKKEMDSQNQDSSTQDAVQEYDEDFEEDIDELANVNSVDSRSIRETVAHAESDSSTSSKSKDSVNKEENGVQGTSKTADELITDDSSEIKSLNPQDSEIKETPPSQISLDFGKKSEKELDDGPEKISTATSPINFKMQSKNVDASVNTSTSLFETIKETKATSPINPKERLLPKTISTLVQTEAFGTREMNVTPDIQNEGCQLTVPPLRLTPRPFENIFKITLGDSNENSLAFHTESSNQTLKLVVQLPSQEEKSGKKKITELDCLEEIHNVSDKESGTDVSANVRRPHPEKEERRFCNTFDQDKLTEQKIKDIIEPTVSQVLKQINEDHSSKNPPCHNVDEHKTCSNAKTTELVKPSVILQTKHGLWKKYDDDLFLNVPDFEQPTPKVDSSNQTEAEKQNACVQVARSMEGSECEKATSVRTYDKMSCHSRGYLEMLLPRPNSVSSARSSHSHISTYHSSSKTTSTASTCSDGKLEGLHHIEKLSDGELLPESCSCQVGEVCEICVPRLDLSFGEVKTRKRSNRMETKTKASANLNPRQSSLSLSDIPLNLEPRPTSERVLISSAPNLPLEPTTDLNPKEQVKPNQPPEPKMHDYVLKPERRLNTKQFSEVAKSVLSDLGKELHIFSGGDHLKQVFHNQPSLSTMKFPSAIGATESSSSASSLTSKSGRSKQDSSKHRTKSKASLVIKTPVETPRIDVVIEDPDVSSSSYQTSVTSVSVDLLPEVLTSHSSADASS